MDTKVAASGSVGGIDAGLARGLSDVACVRSKGCILVLSFADHIRGLSWPPELGWVDHVGLRVGGSGTNP
jgi:hypothetical protein